MVIIGLVLGILSDKYDWLGTLGHVHLTPNIILYILLPTLVFEAAINIDTRLLVKNLVPVMTLALPGLVIATLITGSLVAWLTPLPLGPAMLFGGLISATDPVAVIAVFKELGAPKRLTMLVDGESLFNDATAIVMFDIIVGLLISGAAFGATTVFGAGAHFLFVFFGGTVVGAIIGYIMMQLLRFAKDDPLVKIAFTTVIAYAAFIISQYYLKLSGVMGTVGAGLVVGYFGSTLFSPNVKAYIKQFWEFASFAANCYIFLLLGLTEDYLSRDANHLAHVLLYVVIAIVVVTIARAVIVFGLIPCLNKLKGQHKTRLPYQSIIFWGGLRGALPIGLAMSLNPEIVGGEANRMLILDFTLGVVLFTLLVQGTTVGWLMNKFGLNKLTPLDELEKKKVGAITKKRGLDKIERTATFWSILDKQVLSNIRTDYAEQITQHENAVSAGGTLPKAMSKKGLWLETVSIFNQTVRHMYEEGFVSVNILRNIEHVLDLCRDDIEQDIIPPKHAKNMSAHIESRYTRLRDFVTHIIPIASIREKVEAKQLTNDYLISLVITESVRIQQQHFDKLIEYSGVDEKDAQECHAYIEKINQQVLHHLKALSKTRNKQIVALQENVLRHMALVTENRVLNEIQDYGGVSSKVAGLLEDEIDEKCDELRVVAP